MTNKKIKILKIITCINLVAIVVFSSFMFYGAKYEQYDDITIDGTCSKHNIVDLVRLSYFTNDKMKTSASLNVLKNLDRIQSNYIIKTRISKDSSELNIHIYVSNDKAYGLIQSFKNVKDENGDEITYRTQNPIYIQSSDNKTTYYIQNENIWYYFETNDGKFTTSPVEIIGILENCTYKEFPSVNDSTHISSIHPSDERISVYFCCNKHIGSISYKGISNNEFDTICPQHNEIVSSCLRYILRGSESFDLRYEFDSQGIEVEHMDPDVSNATKIENIDDFVQNILKETFGGNE